MEQWIGPLQVLLVLLAVGLMVYRHIAGKRRFEALKTWAQSHGLTFSAARQDGFDKRFPNYRCLQQGTNRYAHNVMEGKWQGRPVEAFDYHYETHSTDAKGRRQTHHHHFSAVIAHSDVTLEPLIVRPEGVFDRIKEFFGFDDIDLESAEFSRRFYVSAQDKRWAYDVLHPRAMQFLMDQPTFAIQFDPRAAIAWRSRRFAAEDFAAAASVLDTLLGGLPDHVVERQRAKGSA